MKTEHYLRRIVTELAGEIGIRSYVDTARLRQAAVLIAREFRSFGYAVADQPVPYEGNVYNNIIAGPNGRSMPDKVLVIGAHYDTVRATPGADDNASGVAGLLALARELARTPLAKTVRFAAFSLEEPPAFRTRRMGSYHYAQSLKDAGAKIEGMISLEMIGYFNDTPASQQYPLPFFKRFYPAQGNYISLVGNIRSRAFTKRIAESFRRAVDLPVVTLNAPFLVVGIDFSDHWSFQQFGYKAFMVTDTAFYRNPHYHTGTDTPETLDYRRMAQVVKGLAGAVREWDAQ